MKNIIKKLMYNVLFKTIKYQGEISLGYIFHTEKIYDEIVFSNLILFCEKYYKLTGVKPICTIVPPTNLLVKQEMLKNNVSEKNFIERLTMLEKVSTLGYHGHYYLNDTPTYINAIHCNSFNPVQLSRQFIRDIEWFKMNNINNNGIYAGGWWFLNEFLVKLLLKNNFKYDFSISYSPNFYNQYSISMGEEYNIDKGETFFIKDGINELMFIQNFIGLHNTKYPQDFIRNLQMLLPINDFLSISGVVNSHDYDLDINNTINCISYLLENTSIKFCDFNKLIQFKSNIKNIFFEAKN